MEKTARRSVDLRHLVRDDTRFAVESFRPRDRLHKSLKRTGMLTCPWVWACGQERYVVVDGFKRLEWAVSEGILNVDCLVFPEETEPFRLMVLRVEGKLFGPPLNVAEKARMIAELKRCKAPEPVEEGYLAALEIPSRPDAVDAWCRLAASGESLLRAAASEEISERTALELAHWDGNARDGALEILRLLRCSASIQAEILERVKEIARRAGKDKVHVIKDPRIVNILEDKGANHREKTHTLRRFLTRLRFPRLSSREERFSAEVEKACLPGNLRLVPPPSFEGDRWQAVMAFSSPQELEELAGRAGDLARSNLIQSIMHPNRLIPQ
ncbi:MAG: hypothetical protein HGA63_07140 [Syntrophobacteraceae bacterium]|nr:hypothetical protein [Syntrophobacteraceae bacterium]